MMRLTLVCLIISALAGVASAHRLDEYLQATLITVEPDRVELEISLTPGVAVLPVVLAAIDRDRDGRISAEEQRAYANRVLHDVALEADGVPVPLVILGSAFPAVDEMRQGLGTIQVRLRGERPRGHQLRFVNRHLAGISVYLVNCILPASRGLKIERQVRDERQTEIRIDYSFAGDRAIQGREGVSVWPIIVLGLGQIASVWWVWRAKMPDIRPRQPPQSPRRSGSYPRRERRRTLPAALRHTPLHSRR